jgi:hypothetical protein
MAWGQADYRTKVSNYVRLRKMVYGRERRGFALVRANFRESGILE